MAKFCTKCGKPLVEGQTCNCGNAQTPVMQPTNFEQPSVKDFQQANQMNQAMGATMQQNNQAMQTKPTNNLFKECIDIVKQFLKKPVSTIEANANENKFVHAIVITILNAIAACTFVLTLVKELEETIISYLVSMTGLSSYGSLTSLDEIKAQIEIPYVKIFLVTFIAIVAIVALAVLINYLITNKLFKTQTNYKKMFTVYGFASIISTIIFIVAAICNFIEIKVALAVIVIGLLLNQHYVSVALPAACTNADKDKLGYPTVLSILVSIATVVFLLVKIMG